MLTELQRADVRRHLGFGPVGRLPNGGTFISYRFFVTQGQLEFRLSNLAAWEEEILVGSGDPDRPANPNFLDPDGNRVDGYVAICNFLENQLPGITDNLDTTKAGDWTARKDEIEARSKLYNVWRQKMAQFLYVPLGKPLGGVGRGQLAN